MAEIIPLVGWSRKVQLGENAPKKKRCKCCKAEKNRDDFVRDNSCTDNRRNICRECEKERAKENEAKRKDNTDSTKYFTF